MKTGVTTTTETQHHVFYGPLKMADRECKVFVDDADKAQEFFKAKEQLGMHIDVYEVVVSTTTVTKKLTSKE